MVADTLALIAIFSDPANRACLEAEKALANWYRRSLDPPIDERPSVPDRPQPLYLPLTERRLDLEPLPPLTWCYDAVRKFPFTATCVSLALLRGDHDHNTAISDVQFQPLSTIFRGDCKEYGLVVLDISDLETGVRYGIVAFPMRYMTDVQHQSPTGDYGRVKATPPAQEPDVVLESSRPRKLLSIAEWLCRYYSWRVDKHPGVL
jgi:hypothetical protein